MFCPIALQLYSVRNELQKDFPGTLAQVKDCLLYTSSAPERDASTEDMPPEMITAGLLRFRPPYKKWYLYMRGQSSDKIKFSYMHQW